MAQVPEKEESTIQKAVDGVSTVIGWVGGLLLIVAVGWFIGVNILGLAIALLSIPAMVIVMVLNLHPDDAGVISLLLGAVAIGGWLLWRSGKRRDK